MISDYTWWLLGMMAIGLMGIFTWLGEWSRYLNDNPEYEEEDYE